MDTTERLDRLAELLCDAQEGDGQWRKALAEEPRNEMHRAATEAFIEAWRHRARHALAIVGQAGYEVR